MSLIATILSVIFFIGFISCLFLSVSSHVTEYTDFNNLEQATAIVKREKKEYLAAALISLSVAIFFASFI